MNVRGLSKIGALFSENNVNKEALRFKIPLKPTFKVKLKMGLI